MDNYLECVVCGNTNEERTWFVTMVEREHNIGGEEPVCNYCENDYLLDQDS